jgi:hypothetical protein
MGLNILYMFRNNRLHTSLRKAGLPLNLLTYEADIWASI